MRFLPRRATHGLASAVRTAVRGPSAKKNASVVSVVDGLKPRMNSEMTRSLIPVQNRIEVTADTMIHR